MADLSAARRPKRRDLSNRKRREVIVEHKGLISLPHEGVDLLFILRGSEGDDGKNLSLSSREERGTVGPRKDSHLAGNGTDLCQPSSIDPPSLTQNELSHQLTVQILKGHLDHLLRSLILSR